MDEKNKQKAFIGTYQFLYKNKITGFLHRLGHRFVSRLRKNKKGKIIDLGCGRGDHFPYLKDGNFVGLDIDENLLKIAKEKYPNIPLYQGDIGQLPFENESFDGAVSVGVLEHLPDLPKALSEIKRILKPEGEFIFLIPTENFIYKLGRELIVKRHIEKKFKVNYDQLIKEEHVNRHKDIIKEIKNYFKIDKKVGVPFLLPFSCLNIFMVIRCQK